MIFGTVAVMKNELRLLFATPIAYVFLAGGLFLGGLFFLLGLFETGEASLRGAMANLGVVLVFLVPVVTMRQFAEEAKSGTLELLLTAPVPPASLVLGKWLATTLLGVGLLAATAPWAVALSIYGDPDPGALATTWLGMTLCVGGFAAAGLFASVLTTEPLVAAIGGVLLLLPFWLASVAVEHAPATLRPWLYRASFVDHLRSFARGVLDTGDVAWFGLVTTVFLFLTWRTLEARRWR